MTEGTGVFVSTVALSGSLGREGGGICLLQPAVQFSWQAFSIRGYFWWFRGFSVLCECLPWKDPLSWVHERRFIPDSSANRHCTGQTRGLSLLELGLYPEEEMWGSAAGENMGPLGPGGPVWSCPRSLSLRTGAAVGVVASDSPSFLSASCVAMTAVRSPFFLFKLVYIYILHFRSVMLNKFYSLVLIYLPPLLYNFTHFHLFACFPLHLLTSLPFLSSYKHTILRFW